MPKEVAKKKLEMEIYRRNGDTFFRFEVPKEIEEIFSKQDHEIKKSGSWDGLEFYYLPEVTQSEQYIDKLADFKLFDDYGVGFYRNGHLNIAWLRTVGGKGEIKLSGNATFSELSVLARKTIQFLREYFEDFIRDFNIKGSITIED